MMIGIIDEGIKDLYNLLLLRIESNKITDE